MERRGNDGTTAFDFEFDQRPPIGLYIPIRTDGDILFTFEMQGGSTNVAAPHIYPYRSSIAGFDLSDDLADPANPQFLGMYSPQISMNFGATPSEPWGHVNAKGVWSASPIDNAELCEATVFLGPDTLAAPVPILPNVQPFTGGHLYMQVRTRSSVSVNSDLKDTTPFFRYDFTNSSPP